MHFLLVRAGGCKPTSEPADILFVPTPILLPLRTVQPSFSNFRLVSEFDLSVQTCILLKEGAGMAGRDILFSPMSPMSQNSHFLPRGNENPKDNQKGKLMYLKENAS